MHALGDIDTIIDAAAHMVWAASQGKKIDDAIPGITAELKVMMGNICFYNSDEAKALAYKEYVEAHKEVHLAYAEWEAWERRVNMLRCKVCSQ